MANASLQNTASVLGLRLDRMWLNLGVRIRLSLRLGDGLTMAWCMTHLTLWLHSRLKLLWWLLNLHLILRWWDHRSLNMCRWMRQSLCLRLWLKLRLWLGLRLKLALGL